MGQMSCVRKPKVQKVIVFFKFVSLLLINFLPNSENKQKIDIAGVSQYEILLYLQLARRAVGQRRGGKWRGAE